jgi:CheY-like chemotaxis protein
MANRGDSELGALLQSILIVEDEALVRSDTVELLREAGYRVHEAANVGEAMGSIKSKIAIDLLFTDINLGKGMNGVELAVWALANRSDVRVLVTTGDALNSFLPRSLGAILVKPYMVSGLLRRVKQALG